MLSSWSSVDVETVTHNADVMCFWRRVCLGVMRRASWFLQNKNVWALYYLVFSIWLTTTALNLVQTHICMWPFITNLSPPNSKSLCIRGGWEKQSSFQMYISLFLHWFYLFFRGVILELHCFNNGKVKGYDLLSLFYLCAQKYLGGYSNKCTPFHLLDCLMA